MALSVYREKPLLFTAEHVHLDDRAQSEPPGRSVILLGDKDLRNLGKPAKLRYFIPFIFRRGRYIQYSDDKKFQLIARLADEVTARIARVTLHAVLSQIYPVCVSPLKVSYLFSNQYSIFKKIL